MEPTHQNAAAILSLRVQPSLGSSIRGMLSLGQCPRTKLQRCYFAANAASVIIECAHRHEAIDPVVGAREWTVVRSVPNPPIPAPASDSTPVHTVFMPSDNWMDAYTARSRQSPHDAAAWAIESREAVRPRRAICDDAQVRVRQYTHSATSYNRAVGRVGRNIGRSNETLALLNVWHAAMYGHRAPRDKARWVTKGLFHDSSGIDMSLLLGLRFHTAGVIGSIPVPPTIKIDRIQVFLSF